MSPIQAIVLMALEEPFTHEQLVQKLQIPNDDHHNLEGVLESLAKAMIVRKNNDEKWCWYTQTSQSQTITRVFVPPVKNLKQTKEEKETLCPIVIEAFIVKILKHEKRMKYFQLLDLVAKRYKVRLVEIKHRIEKLIDGEFISKEEDNHLCYIP